MLNDVSGTPTMLACSLKFEKFCCGFPVRSLFLEITSELVENGDFPD